MPVINSSKWKCSRIKWVIWGK